MAFLVDDRPARRGRPGVGGDLYEPVLADAAVCVESW